MPRTIDTLREAARAYGYGTRDTKGRVRNGAAVVAEKRRTALAKPSPALLARFDRAWQEFTPDAKDAIRAWLGGEYLDRSVYRHVRGAPVRFGLRTTAELRRALAAIGVGGGE